MTVTLAGDYSYSPEKLTRGYCEQLKVRPAMRRPVSARSKIMASLVIVWRNPNLPVLREWRVKKGVVPGIYVVEVYAPNVGRWASLFVLTVKKPEQATRQKHTHGKDRNWCSWLG